MGDEIPEWRHMWGAKVKVPLDMPDDVLRFAVETSVAKLEEFPDFETDGLFNFTFRI